MLVDFSFSNYRSFKEENTLSMRSTKKTNTQSDIMPLAALFGKNGGGKSNVLKALQTAVNFISAAGLTQTAGALVPVTPFALDDFSYKNPTSFEFEYTFENNKYLYGFAATKEKIVTEYLYHYPNGCKTCIFDRKGQLFKFTKDRSLRELICHAVSENQLYFSVACVMNDTDCINAMRFFKEDIMFSMGFVTVPALISKDHIDENVLKAMTQYVRNADMGICDLSFDISGVNIDEDNIIKSDISSELAKKLSSFISALSRSSCSQIKESGVCAKAYHKVKTKDGKGYSYMRYSQQQKELYAYRQHLICS